MAPEHRHPHSRSPDQPVSVWKESEQIDGKSVSAGVVILRTSGCSHYHAGGCSMCGYNFESDVGVTPADIVKQFDHAMKDLDDVGFLKVYTSGSFLDESEISRDVADHILRTAAIRNLRVLFESRPEYVTSESLERVIAVNQHIEIALGLESSNDRVLRYSVNKGFTRADYERAARTVADKGIDSRTYVLLKPPYLTESEAVMDAKEAIRFASGFSRTVSLNPVNVQKGTLVERLWRNWAYRPPWLWSVLEVLKASHGKTGRLVCDPTGGGRDRGAHNCGRCDDAILASIKAYSQSQDLGRLGWPDCDCRDVWRSVVDMEGFAVGGTVDLQRHFRRRA
jgi:radical SAM enzyme (TIGR01210 family)